jgi:uncharacterized protein
VTTPGGHLPDHVARFGRVLRAAGLPVGTDRLEAALRAAAAIGVTSEPDLYWALHATLVGRAEHRAVFDAAFRLYWRGAVAGPGDAAPAERAGRPRPGVSRRVAEALAAEQAAHPRAAPARNPEREAAAVAWSDVEALRTRDFEGLSADELRQAEAAVAALRPALPDLPARRLRPDPAGDRVDPRASLRAALRAGGEALPLRWRAAATRPPVVVALVDVSGSMTRYARMFLLFLHALARGAPGAVHAFTFATRLTPVTRALRHRDADEALAIAGRLVGDWDAGTRIGEALRAFNLRWGRRLLGPGAVVLLVTDGLDRDDARGLAAEAARLRRSCRRLVWLNPLLRWSGFEPKAAGVRALLPQVDELRPVHDLDSLARLAEALRSQPAARAASTTAAAAGRAGAGRSR